MRVSIVNCVSTASDMMRFSDESLFSNAEHGDFDYVVVKWLADEGVERYLCELPGIARSYYSSIRVHVLEHPTNPQVGYVPNLRGMMNGGFDFGFLLNDYCGLTNTDVYHGLGWLSGLVKYAAPDRVVNSLHITAASPPYPVAGIVTENLGVPLPGVFNGGRFFSLSKQLRQEKLLLAGKLGGQGGYRQCATMPYLFHRRYWNECGPWELTAENGTPDVRFFDRVAAAGAEFALSYESVIYHHEAVERRGRRPPGAEGMREE